MYRIIKYAFIISVFISFFSCEDNKVAIPSASISVNSDELNINESVVVNFHGTADQVVVYTGDTDHDYELRDQSNTGFVMNKGTLTYSYRSPGTYKIVCVASTYNDNATELHRDTCSFYIKVIDNVTEIQKISCPQIIYDEVFAKKINDNEWLMQLPQKIKYKSSTPTISSSQKLQFYIGSELTKIYINNTLFNANKKYDLSSPLEIKVVSNFGTEKIYRLHTVRYPEFKSFSINGIKGELLRSEFDYSSFTMKIQVPESVDLTNAIPIFETTDASDKVYIGSNQQISGQTTVDLSKATTYKIVRRVDGINNQTTESQIKIMIIK